MGTDFREFVPNRYTDLPRTAILLGVPLLGWSHEVLVYAPVGAATV